MKTRVTELLGIAHPIVQAGMSWASSNAALPAAVSNAGGLGVLAAGPMYVEDFTAALAQIRALTSKPYAVNIPLYRPQVDEILDAMQAQRVPVVIASQGGPKKHLARFHAYGARWLQVVSTLEHALKAEAAGVDGLIVVGAEAGGHPPANGVSTLVTVRQVLRQVQIPVIAGGGAADGWAIAALLALGADAVQLGTRFLLTHEASVHANYKNAVLQAGVADPVLVGKRNLPVRMLHNDFASAVYAAEQADVSAEVYDELFKSSTLRQAALDGDVVWGKVEAGQCAGLIDQLQFTQEVMGQLVQELHRACARLHALTGCIEASAPD